MIAIGGAVCTFPLTDANVGSSVHDDRLVSRAASLLLCSPGGGIPIADHHGHAGCRAGRRSYVIGKEVLCRETCIPYDQKPLFLVLYGGRKYIIYPPSDKLLCQFK